MPSGTTDWVLSGSDALIEALDRVQIRPSAITSQHLISGRRSLNLVLQTFANRGVNLWAVDLQTLELVVGQNTYDVPADTISVLDMYFRTPITSTSPQQYSDRYMESISRTDYASYANKDQQGYPTVFWFDRLNSPTITLYQSPIVDTANDGYYIQYYRMRRLQDANATGLEDMDLNYRFYEALCAELAARLAEKYSPELEAGMRQKAKMAWDEAAAEDREDVTLHITPNLSGYFRQ